ncbi:MAG: hypothetical protein AAGG46_00160 [Planctomycetota bacterium]
MIKQAMSEAGLGVLAAVGVTMFVLIFLAIVAWTLSRSRKQVDKWSSLPLADGTDPVEPRVRPAEQRTGSQK